jgi:hypothetical protein
MTREELELKATQAIGRWNDPSLPLMPGKPIFQAATKEPLKNIAVACQLLEYNGHGYIYLFDAQEVLDSFNAITFGTAGLNDKLEKAWGLSIAG